MAMVFSGINTSSIKYLFIKNFVIDNAFVENCLHLNTSNGDLWDSYEQPDNLPSFLIFIFIFNSRARCNRSRRYTHYFFIQYLVFGRKKALEEYIVSTFCYIAFLECRFHGIQLQVIYLLVKYFICIVK